MIKIIFLGTAGATPTKKRALPSVAIEYKGKIYLFDCGEGTQRQFLKYGLNMSKISCIFLTHVHADHVIGIAGLIRTLSINKRTEALSIYVPEGEEAKVRNLAHFDDSVVNYEVVVKPIKTGTVLKNKDLEIRAFKLNHSVLTYGYVIKEGDRIRFIKEKAAAAGIKGIMFQEILKKKRLQVNKKNVSLSSISFLETGKKVVYATDTRPCKAAEKNAANADLLIHEATYTEALKAFAKDRKHSTAREAATIAKNAHVKRLILFHISARYKDTKDLLEEARKTFKNTEIANDGLEIVL